MNLRVGFLNALGAFGIWGFFPLFWKLLERFNSLDLLAIRLIASVITIAPLLYFKKKNPITKLLQSKQYTVVIISALLIGINWYLFIYAVNSKNTLQASLGYFMGPLFNLIFGVWFLKETLKKIDFVVIGFLVLGIGTAFMDLKSFPWISITLAMSFSLYGLVKKRVNMSATESIFLEALLFAPVAIFLLKDFTIATITPLEWGLFLASGLLTFIPLVFFTNAALNLPLSTLGYMQYIAPSLQFFIGYFIFGEALSMNKLVQFTFVWVGLTIYTIQRVKKKRI
jgi:chloramphenicol-sensitive protein RarD